MDVDEVDKGTGRGRCSPDHLPCVCTVKKKCSAGLKLSNLMNLGRKKSSSLEPPERSLETSSKTCSPPSYPQGLKGSINTGKQGNRFQGLLPTPRALGLPGWLQFVFPAGDSYSCLRGRPAGPHLLPPPGLHSGKLDLGAGAAL